MRVLTTVLMTLIATACGSGTNSKKDKPETSKVPEVQQPISPDPVPPVTPPVLDKTPPRAVGVSQKGLEKIVVEFSEPIKRIDTLHKGPVFGTETWSADRKLLTVPFDVKKIPSGTIATLIIRGIVDDANNRETQELTIPVDHLPPALEGVKVIDSRNLLITFNEAVQFTEQSSFLVDGRAVGQIVSANLPAQQATVQFADIDLTAPDSHLFTVKQVADVYGNIADQRSRGFAQSEDKEAPRIVSIKQLPTKNNGTMAFLGFELEFSEYVVDSRDSDGGMAGQLAALLDSMKEFTINGKEDINILGQWIPRDDHRGGTLYLPSLSIETQFNNNEINTIGLVLTDALGNSQLATATLVVDSEAPWFQGYHLYNDQCEMSGLRGFRCRISEPDVVSAVLKPEKAWPVTDYTVSTSTETTADKVQHWLNFTFQKDISETTVDDILITDKMGNTNKDLISYTVRYFPTAARPELVKATAFSNSILELEFNADVGSIDTVLVDGLPKTFTMTSVDNFRRSYLPANVLVHFSEPVPDGIHKIEIKGATRSRNKAARAETISLDNLDNRDVDIIQSSITQEPDLWRTTDLRFEVTRSFTGTLLAFAEVTRTDRPHKSTPFTDFTLKAEGMTPRGTYLYRLHKETSAALEPLEYTQGIVLQIPGCPAAKLVYTTWSTEEPRFYVMGYAKPNGFTVDNLALLDLDSLVMEIVSKDGVIPIERSWISPYASEDGRDVGFTVSLPENIVLKTGAFLYKLRVKAARTINFGIDLTKPFEANLTVK